MTGSDGLDLLNRLSTNLVDPLAVGSVISTVLTNNKGRIIDLIKVVRLENGLLILTSPLGRKSVEEWINKYTIVEDIELVDITESSAMLALSGPLSEDVLLHLLQRNTLDCKVSEAMQVPWKEGTAIIIRTDSFGMPGFDIIVDLKSATPLWESCTEISEDVGITLAGQQAIEALRIENRIPKWGSELSLDYNPIEAGLTSSISWSKGCYIGQEVIARLWTYHKVQKYLVGIVFDSSLPPVIGSDLRIQSKKVGILTSVTFHPKEGKHRGLGYLKSSEVRIGSLIDVGSEFNSMISGEIVAIPEIPSHQIPKDILGLEDELEN
jgi:folate-binding protein YgfZ